MERRSYFKRKLRQAVSGKDKKIANRADRMRRKRVRRACRGFGWATFGPEAWAADINDAFQSPLSNGMIPLQV